MGPPAATVLVVASDAPEPVKAMAWALKAFYPSQIYICDGVLDEIEIQAGLEWLNSFGAGIERLVGKTFYISVSIGSLAGTSKYNNVLMQGDGVDATKVKMTGDSTNIDIRGSAGARIQSFGIKDLTLEGNQASVNPSIAALRLDYIDYLFLDNIKAVNIGNPVLDTQGIGIGFNFVRYGKIGRLQSVDYTHYGLNLTSVSECYFESFLSLHNSTFPVPANSGNHAFYLLNSTGNNFGAIGVKNPNNNTDLAGVELVQASSHNNIGLVICEGHANNWSGVHLDPGIQTMIGNHFGIIDVSGFNFGMLVGNGPILTTVDSFASFSPTLDSLSWATGGSSDLYIGKFISLAAGRNGIRWNTNKLRIGMVHVEDAQNEAIYLDEYARRCEFLGGVIKNNGRALANTYAGIHVAHANSVYNTIDGIIFEDDAGFQKLGIESIGDYLTIGPTNVYIGNISGAVSHTGVNDKVRGGIGYVRDNSGASVGTGAQQTIAHGLAFTPTRQQIALTPGSATAVPFHSAAPDATNIYVTAAFNQPWYWATAGQ